MSKVDRKSTGVAAPAGESSAAGEKKTVRNSRRRRQQAEEAQQMSFEFYLSEGNTYRNTGELHRAITGYSKALDIRPDHKGALLARSHCYLQLGDCKAAIADANATLADDPKFYRGLLQKADINYQMGEFELALVLYHRGHKLRPDVEAFRLGIQLCREAIDNTIGETANVKLEKKGDLSFFTEMQQTKNQDAARTVSYSDASKQHSSATRRRSKASTNKKTLKQLLEQLYDDKVFLEELVDESEKVNKDSKTSEEMIQIGSKCLDYLDQRATFWQQKQPTMARRKKQKTVLPTFDTRDVEGWLLENLEQIDTQYSSKEYSKCIAKCNNVLKRLDTCTKDELKKLNEYKGQIHSYIGNCYFEMKKWDQALEHHDIDHQLAMKCKSTDARTRSMENIARVQFKRKEYESAEKILKERLTMSKDNLEKAWIHHEIGRCQLEMKKFKKSRASGEQALIAATDCGDDMWKLNSLILIAQSCHGLEQFASALDNYRQARELADSIGDHNAVETIEMCIAEVNRLMERREGQSPASNRSRTSSASGQSGAEERSARDQSKTESPARADELDSSNDQSKSAEVRKESVTAEKSSVRKELTAYSITVKISDVENAGTNSKLFVELIGNSGKSDRLSLDECVNNADNKLQRSTETEFLVRTKDVGKLTSIRIGHDSDIPRSGPHVASVRVRSHTNTAESVFPCHRWLDKSMDDRLTVRELQLAADEAVSKGQRVTYHVAVRTVDEDDAGTDGKVHVQIYGDKGETEKLFLDTSEAKSESYDPGQTNEFDLEAFDVGQVRTIRLEHQGESWMLDDVTVDVGGKTYHFAGNVRLQKNDSCQLLAD